ncbi:hypothetical protein TWF718_004530 [Orbilia javanica]|uniref:Uncharacterized protein n=1 Tax=Orbilia javanica TaxID=47235 RepID=A0AAN8RL32_9PEZI
MHMQTVVVIAAGLAATASASAAIPANPIVKHVALRAINIDGSFAGLIFKRQTSCPAGYTACGSGCSLGPCCDADAGLACRPGEVCSPVDGEIGCCPDGYVCNGIRSCQNAVGGYCTPGSVDNGVLCCDAAAPLCSTSSGVPYCAGVAPSTTVTANPYQTGGQGGGFDSTTTTSSTITSTVILTRDPSSDTVPPTYATGGETEAPTTEAPTTEAPTTEAPTTEAPTTEAPTEVPTTEAPTEVPTTEAPTEEPTEAPTTEVPTDVPTATTVPTETYVGPSVTDSATISTPTYAAEPSTSTFTSTAVIVVPYPPGNGTNATATSSPSPPEATGAAGKLGVSGFALTVALGLAFLL